MKKKIKTIIFLSFCLSFFSQIISNDLNQQINKLGFMNFDFDSDGNNVYAFEIIDLGSEILAARVLSLGTNEILDYSTIGYPDTLNFGNNVSGYFHNGYGALGTYNSAG